MKVCSAGANLQYRFLKDPFSLYIAQTEVTEAQVEDIVGKVKRGFFNCPVRHLQVSIAFPPPKTKTISASITDFSCFSFSTFS